MKINRLIPALLLLLICSLLTFAFVSLAYGDADNNYPQGSDPCGGTASNPDHFQVTPDQGPPGSIFFLSGKPHDTKTVGPGSDVMITWKEKPADPGVSAQVNSSGKFVAAIKVPSDFSPGKHVLMYLEASPYASCLEYTVTAAHPTPPAGSASSTDGESLGNFLVFLVSLLFRLI